MSARLLRKVLEENEQNQKALLPLQQQEEKENDISPKLATSVVANPFSLLTDDESAQEDVDYELADDANDCEERPDREIVEEDARMVPAFSKKSGKKKKKKKQKSVASFTSEIQNRVEIEDRIEKLTLSEMPSSEPQKFPSSWDANQEDLVSSILRTDPKRLNPENELIRIFGSKVVKSFDKGSQASNSRQSRGGRRRFHHSRKTKLVSSLDHWPLWDGSLSMELLESKNGCHYFRYLRSSSYDQGQRAFESAKTLHDLNAIAAILVHHPYHLESLLTMADYFQFVGEHQMSSDAIAKSLYALECAWHPLFTPLQGNCQLKMCHEANASLFKVMFTHMKNLDRRGCHCSALEVCKLLLSLDLDDPMGTLFCIDYFALRAEEYEWLERFSEMYQSDQSLWLFPNFSFSLAICRFYLEQKELSNNSLVSLKSTSSDLMNQALMLHPYVLKRLVGKVPLKDKIWIDILKLKFFRSENSGSPSLDHLVNIYVERSYILWRLPELQKLLRDSALKVSEMLEHNSNGAMDWECARKEAFSPENNEYSHLLVSDFSDSVPTIPPENLQDFIVDANMREVVDHNENGLDNVRYGEHVLRDVANRHPLAVLFESFLPWANYGQRDNDDDYAEHNGHGHEEANGN